MVISIHARASMLAGIVVLAGCSAKRIAGASGSEDSGSETNASPEDLPPPEDFPPPEQGTWEGLLELCEPDDSSPWDVSSHSHFLPCGSDERWRIDGQPISPVNGCTSVWVVVSGTLIHDWSPCPDQQAPADQKTLVVDVLLDVRVCEPSDCGGSPRCKPENLECAAGAVYCNLLFQDCAEGERCLPSHHYEFDIKPPYTSCYWPAVTPLQVGEPCLVWGGSGTDLVDDCDVGSMCVPLEDGDPSGFCRAFCDPEGLEGAPCNGNCAPCNPATPYDVGLCFEDCPECTAVPHC